MLNLSSAPVIQPAWLANRYNLKCSITSQRCLPVNSCFLHLSSCPRIKTQVARTCSQSDWSSEAASRLATSSPAPAPSPANYPQDPSSHLLQNHSNSDVVSINCNVKLNPNQEIHFQLLGNLWLRSLKAVSGGPEGGWRGDCGEVPLTSGPAHETR